MADAEKQAEWWDQLREPFPANVIGKLPKLNCLACAQKKDGPKSQRHCDRHTVTECKVCGNYITTGHIHLDYVGHATTTDRILKVDPEWTWRPMATEIDTGFPKFDSQGGLWILLTIKGVTRPGYGDGKTPKEVIGDAIRNAAMRFGVALDLWAKEDLQAAEPKVSESRPVRQSKPVAVDASAPAPAASAAQDEHVLSTNDLKLPPEARKVITAAQVKKMWTMARGFSLSDDQVREIVVGVGGVESSKLIPRGRFEAVLDEIEMTGKGVQA
jgi:hypothetical protein